MAPTTPFVPFPAAAVERSIPARFEEQARQHADRLAVRTPRHELTYAALDHTANRVARAILTRTGNRAEPIALLFEHGASMLVALLGVLKAGKCFVALDPTYPRGRLTTMLADTDSRLLITDASSWSLAKQLAGPGVQLLDVDALDPALPSDDLALPIAPDALAYILYTSGSTGQPKGVVHDHRGLLHTIMKYTNGSHISADDRLTLLFSYGFGAAMTNIFGALLNGASLFPYDLRKETMAQMAARVDRDGITVYHSVPTVFRYFADTLTGAQAFQALRLIEPAGEPVTRARWSAIGVTSPAIACSTTGWASRRWESSGSTSWITRRHCPAARCRSATRLRTRRSSCSTSAGSPSAATTWARSRSGAAICSGATGASRS